MMMMMMTTMMMMMTMEVPAFRQDVMGRVTFDLGMDFNVETSISFLEKLQDMNLVYRVGRQTVQ